MKIRVPFLLFFLVSTCACVSIVSAENPDPWKESCDSYISGSGAQVSGCKPQDRRESMRTERETRRAENRTLRATNTGATHDFHESNSGTIRDAVKSLSGTQRDALKDARDTQEDMRRSLSGKTLEQKLDSRDALEAAQVAKIQAKYANNPELLAKSLAVYEQNKSRRDQIAANRMENLIVRSALTLEKIQVLDTQIRENMNSVSPDRRLKLVTKIDKKLEKLSQAKGLTASTIAEITRILTTLEADLLVAPIASV